MSLEEQIRELARAAKVSTTKLRKAPSAQKNAVLHRAADQLRGAAAERVLAANASDCAEAEERGLSTAMLDRLKLTKARLDSVAEGILSVERLPDPVGHIVGMRRLPNGLSVGQMRVPLGLVGMIYESRPNVTADAAALCIKSGNGVVLRGGSEAFRSNQAIARVFESALDAEGLPKEAVSLLPTTDREATRVLIGLEGIVDVVIPRGGEALIRFVAKHAAVPVIRHYKGVCHVYIDGDADLDEALRIVVNAKVQRPGVCNAMETLLIDQACASAFLPSVGAALRDEGVEVRGDEATRAVLTWAQPATAEDWDTEYLDRIVSVRVVEGFDAAVAHIEQHGSNHTEAIVTRNYQHAQRWLQEVDASLVLVNASTRFNDGFELGLGAELGISTTKLHCYGPMGLEELCALKWIGYGSGQIRS